MPVARLTSLREHTGPQVARALRDREPLALAELLHRTVAGAHGCARRLLGRAGDVEDLLGAVYADAWARPPEVAALGGWVRAACFRVGAALLRRQGRPPASQALAALLPDLPAPAGHVDPLEASLAALSEDGRRAVLLAHDAGVPSTAQGPDAPGVLLRALARLAGDERHDAGPEVRCAAAPGSLADWVLDVAPTAPAADVRGHVDGCPACAHTARDLLGARRRLEGLPPAPDLGPRLVAFALAGTTGSRFGPAPTVPQAGPGPARSALDDLPPPVSARAETGTNPAREVRLP